jgi:hypothetical protein
MSLRPWPWIAIVALGAAGALVVGRQLRDGARMKAEIAAQRAAARERTALLAENRRLVAAQMPVEELDRLRAERAAVTGLRTNLDAVKRRAAESPPQSPPAEIKPRERSLTDGTLSAAEWRNAGAANPAAAFESVLWAAAHGEVGALADRLAFETGAEAKASAIFAQLPDALQRELGSPAQMIAVLTAKDVPLGSAQITGEVPSAGETKIVTQLTSTDGKQKSAEFRLRNANGTWQLVVSDDVVDRCAIFLGAPVAAPAPGK